MLQKNIDLLRFTISIYKGFLLTGYWLLLFLACHNTSQAAELPALETHVSDTIAGYTTLVKTESPFANQEIVFDIIKPDQTHLIIHGTSNQKGEAMIDLYDYHTKQAGIYQAAARFNHQDEFGKYTSFQVYADEVSPHS